MFAGVHAPIPWYPRAFIPYTRPAPLIRSLDVHRRQASQPRRKEPAQPAAVPASCQGDGAARRPRAVQGPGHPRDRAVRRDRDPDRRHPRAVVPALVVGRQARPSLARQQDLRRGRHDRAARGRGGRRQRQGIRRQRRRAGRLPLRAHARGVPRHLPGRPGTAGPRQAQAGGDGGQGHPPRRLHHHGLAGQSRARPDHEDRARPAHRHVAPDDGDVEDLQAGSSPPRRSGRRRGRRNSRPNSSAPRRGASASPTSIRSISASAGTSRFRGRWHRR